ncbi:RDD family protein [Piscinibacter sp.]|jgi:uncharacterized RDD family membrane protein YckC|uniref:RDD family protein n=1 Tax=Piscinibacter sp. TaxID=1903157 RepID=UPI002F41AC8B
MSEVAGATPSDLSAPGLPRRLACFVYEGVLLFGVLMIAGYLFSSLTQQRHANIGRHGLQAFLFIVLGIYFTWFWSHGGQTVAMKAWHVRLVDRHGAPVSQARALARYLLSWLWFMPALLVLYLTDMRDLGTIFGVMLAGVLGYALLSRLHPTRQFFHDVVSGTRLVTHRPVPQRRA